LATPKQKSVIQILHVDDDVCFLEVSKEILASENNFEICNVTSVDEAIQKLKEQNYDAIVSDYEMPQKNGLDFLKELKQQQKDIPFILFTGKGREEVAVKALNLGADSYINKNGSPETVYCELANVINRFVKHKKAEKDVLNQKVRAEQYLNIVGSIILALDVQGKITLLNKKGYEILGYEEGELNGKIWVSTCLPREIRDESKKTFDEWIQGKVKPPKNFENEVITKFGEKRSISWHNAELRDENGQLTGTLSSGEDITEHKNFEEVLIAAEEKFRTIFENVQDVITYVDTHGKILDVNNRIEDLLGYKREEIIGKNFAKLGLVNFLDIPKLLKLFIGSIRKREEQRIVVLELKHKNGKKVSVEVGTRFIRDKKGKIVSIVNIFRDITENKKVEAALIESEEKFRRVFAIGHDAFLISDLKESIVIEVNERFREMFGYDRQEVIGKSAIQLGFWANLPDRERIAQTLKTKGKVENLEILCKRKNGESFPVLLSVSLLQAKNQQLVLSTAKDLSNFKQTEDALKESEEKLKAIVDGASDGIMVADSKTKKIEFANPKSSEITGYSQEELTKLSIDNLHLEKDLPYVTNLIKNQMQRKSTLATNLPILRKDGTIIHCDVNAQPAKIGSQEFLVGFFRDVTERKKTEEALKESEEKFRNLAEESPNMIFINTRGRVLYANKKCEEVTGYSREELCSPSFNFLSLCAPEYVEVMRSSYVKHLKGDEVSPYDYVLVAKGGKRSDVMTTSKLIDYNGEKAILGIVTDISELKKAEENLNHTMNELVNLNEKLGVVGSLTRHDVRNKLSVITGNIFLLKKKHRDCAEIMDRLGQMDQACGSILKILEFTKMYEQLGVEELTYVNVEKAVDEATALLSSTSNVKLTNETQGLTVLADSFLRQLYYNFIDNSLKHGQHATRIKVHFEKTEEEKLNIIYEDDGIGVPAENKPMLFKEGFSTGGTSGYGLYLIRKMIEVYGWTIEENGEPGKGAKFVMTIPKVNQKGKENYRMAS
jgi:PAS domain S-box-containing protein